MIRGLPPPPVPGGAKGKPAEYFKDVPTRRLVLELQRHWHQYRGGSAAFYRRKNAYTLIDFLRALHERADRSVFLAATKLIRSPKRRERMQGFAILRELGYSRPKFKETWGVLDRALKKEKDPVVRHWALSSLAWTHDKRALPQLFAHANHPHPWVREVVADRLLACANSIKDSRVIDSLIVLAEDDDADVRWSALYEIVMYIPHTSRLREMLKRRTHDRSPRIKRMAKESLCRGRPEEKFF